MPKKQLAIAILALLLTAPCVAAPVLHITTEHSPPASMLAGRTVTGHGTEKVREIMARSGISYTIELLPWKRAYTSALSRSNGCVFSTTRTDEREKLFKWVGPTDSADWVLMAKADRQFDLRTLEDARGLRIGTYNGDAREEYLRSRGFKIDSAQNDLINPQKLLMKRIDLWAASLSRGSAVLEQNGWTGLIVPALVFAKVKVYLACNPAVPDALVARMNASLEAMERDGTARRIERKFEQIPPEKAPGN